MDIGLLCFQYKTCLRNIHTNSYHFRNQSTQKNVVLVRDLFTYTLVISYMQCLYVFKTIYAYSQHNRLFYLMSGQEVSVYLEIRVVGGLSPSTASFQFWLASHFSKEVLIWPDFRTLVGLCQSGLSQTCNIEKECPAVQPPFSACCVCPEDMEDEPQTPLGLIVVDFFSSHKST